MATEKYDGFKLTTKDMDFEPVELTIEITSREVYDAVVKVVTLSDRSEDSVVNIAYELDNDYTNTLIDALFRAIIK